MNHQQQQQQSPPPPPITAIRRLTLISSTSKSSSSGITWMMKFILMVVGMVLIHEISWWWNHSNNSRNNNAIINHWRRSPQHQQHQHHQHQQLQPELTTLTNTITTHPPTKPNLIQPIQPIANLPPPTNSLLSNITSRTIFHRTKTLQHTLFQLSDGVFNHSLTETGEPWLKWIPSQSRYAKLYSTYSTNEAITSCLANKRILLIGTSYQRILFWDLLRVFDKNLPYEPLNKYVSHNNFYWEKTCPINNHQQPPLLPPFLPHDPGWTFKLINRTTSPLLCYWVRNDTICQYQYGLPGFDISSCGLPMQRRVVINNGNPSNSSSSSTTLISFTMKTYLSTPIVDERIRQEVDSEKWDLIITSGGEWGKHGPLSPNKYKELSHQQAVNEFLDTIGITLTSKQQPPPILIHRCQYHGFKTSTRVLCSEATGSKRNLPGFHDRHLMNSLHNFDRKFRKEHGFEGPMVETSMRIMMAAVCAPIDEL
jgi:hypothetical protein